MAKSLLLVSSDDELIQMEFMMTPFGGSSERKPVNSGGSYRGRPLAVMEEFVFIFSPVFLVFSSFLHIFQFSSYFPVFFIFSSFLHIFQFSSYFPVFLIFFSFLRIFYKNYLTTNFAKCRFTLATHLNAFTTKMVKLCILRTSSGYAYCI